MTSEDIKHQLIIIIIGGCVLSLSLSLYGGTRDPFRKFFTYAALQHRRYFFPVSADMVELARTKVYIFTDRQSPTTDFGGTKTDVPEIK